MNNKRANGKRKRIEDYKMKKLQAKTKVTADYDHNKSKGFPLPKWIEIAIKTELEYGEPLLIQGLKKFETFK